MESWMYHRLIFEQSKSEEEITEMKDRSPVQNDWDPINNPDEDKQRVLIAPT